jgi:hypothetical protein
MASKARSLNHADYQRIGQNAAIFTLPVIVIWLGLFIQGEVDPKVYAVAGAVWLQGVLIDIYRKWSAGK